MNAHHKKRSHRPSTPNRRTLFSSGSLLASPPTGAASVPPASTSEPTASEAVEFVRKRKFEEKKSQTGVARLAKIGNRVPFGWQLDLTVPSQNAEGAQLPQELEDLIVSQCSFQYSASVNLADLLEPGFMQTYVRKGKLMAISLDGDEGSDIVAIDGRRRLVLSVSKDTYQLLGLPGRPSLFGTLGQRYIIEIDLRAPAFLAGKPGYESTKAKLRKWPRQTSLFDELRSEAVQNVEGRRFEMVFSFVNDEGKSEQIDFPTAIVAEVRKPTVTRRTITTSIPDAATIFQDSEDVDSQSQRLEDSEGFLNFLASVSFPLLATNPPPSLPFLPSTSSTTITTFSITSFFHPSFLSTLLTRPLPSASSTPFLHYALHPVPHSPFGHLAARENQPATRKRKNGKRSKRGKGQGEEEEIDGDAVQGGGEGVAWEVLLLASSEGAGGKWCAWERV